jgi:uncharacterized protein (DUF1330 family)
MSALLITVGRFRKGGGEALRHCVAGVVPPTAGAGGEVVSRGRLQETVVGDAGTPSALVAVVRFPDAATIRGLLDRHAYRANETYRNEAFEDIRSYIADDLMTQSEENA